MKDIKNADKTPDISRDEREKVAIQHTIQSAISSEFQDFSIEEKAAMVTTIYTAFVEAFNTGEPISPSIDYRITPEIYNEFLAHSYTTSNEYSRNPLKVLTYKEIAVGVDKIFERELNYHEYIGKSLVIFQARIIPSFRLTHKANSEKEITAIDVNICIAITPELNKILVKSEGSLSTALELTNQLLNIVKPQVKDIT